MMADICIVDLVRGGFTGGTKPGQPEPYICRWFDEAARDGDAVSHQAAGCAEHMRGSTKCALISNRGW